MREKNANTVQQEQHLRDYWRVVWNGRWTVLSIFAVVVILGTVTTMLQKPTYEAGVILLLDARPQGVVPGSQVAPMGATEYGYLAEERYFNTQYRILRSRNVARRVMTELNLYQHEAFEGLDDPEKAFIRRVGVQPVEATGVVRVSMIAGDAEEAALWANSLADAYVARNLQQAVDSTRQAVNSLLQQMQPLREELRKNELERLEFAGENALYVSKDPRSVLQRRLDLLQQDLTKAQVRLIGVQGIHDKVAEFEKNGGDYLVLPRISDDVTVRDLVRDRNRLETELRRLQVTYKQGHFTVQEKLFGLEKINQKIEGEVARIVGAIRTEFSLVAREVEQIESAISKTKEDSVSLGKQASDYDFLSGEADDSRRLYDTIATRIKEVELNTKLLRNNVSVLDAAIVPNQPVSPRKVLNAALSIALGLILGMGTVFFLDYLDNTVKTSEDVERYLGMSILALIPRKRAQAERMIKESLQNLRTNLNFSSLNRSRRVILVTSAGPQEGKTSTIVALARVQASAGDRVILVDCDLRRPSVHNHLKLKRNFGLTNYLADASEENSWRKYLKTTDTPNLDVLTCGPIPPNPPELFGTGRFRELLEQLKSEYDWVLIDSPPVASLSDTRILSSLVDMVALVIRHRENDRELIRRCVESLREVNPNVVGAILNDVDVSRSHYRDYYYAGYYYYGSEESEKGKDVRKRFLGGRKTG